jgi:hypothetical protein
LCGADDNYPALGCTAGVAWLLHCPVGLKAAVLEVTAVPLLVLPTAIHAPPEGHDSPATPMNFGGAVALTQLAPPLVLERKTGAAAPVPMAPPATHEVAEAQETSKTAALATGNVTALKVLPPSVVSTASPGAAGLFVPTGLGPTATQRLTLGQVMDRSCPVPPLTATGVQVVPASLLTRTFEPTAMQRVAVVQAIAAIPATKEGTLLGAQVLPPSEETKMTA